MTTATTRTTTLRANNLTCPSCIAKIEKALNNLNGVSKAQVHFTTGRISVEHDPSVVDGNALVKAVADAGYDARVSAF